MIEAEELTKRYGDVEAAFAAADSITTRATLSAARACGSMAATWASTVFSTTTSSAIWSGMAAIAKRCGMRAI